MPLERLVLRVWCKSGRGGTNGRRTSLVSGPSRDCAKGSRRRRRHPPANSSPDASTRPGVFPPVLRKSAAASPYLPSQSHLRLHERPRLDAPSRIRPPRPGGLECFCLRSVSNTFDPDTSPLACRWNKSRRAAQHIEAVQERPRESTIVTEPHSSLQCSSLVGLEMTQSPPAITWPVRSAYPQGGSAMVIGAP